MPVFDTGKYLAHFVPEEKGGMKEGRRERSASGQEGPTLLYDLLAGSGPGGRTGKAGENEHRTSNVQHRMVNKEMKINIPLFSPMLHEFFILS